MAGNHADRICAAGVQHTDPNTVADLLHYYPLEDKVNALLHDKIGPEKPFLHQKRKYDCTQDVTVADLINPPAKSKYEVIAENLKETVFASYWKKCTGKPPDRTPMFPDGFDIETTCYGKMSKQNEVHGFDLLYPKDVDLGAPESKQPGVLTNRNYCKPSFSKDYTYGIRLKYDNTGAQMKCCLQHDEINLGKSRYTPNCETLANFQDRTLYKPGRRLPANVNMPRDVLPPLPKGYCFGKPTPPCNIAACFTECDLNLKVKQIRESLAHINVLRINNKLKWKQDPCIFQDLFDKFKWIDINHSKFKSHWLPKEIVYNKLLESRIVIKANLVEPILKLFRSFDGDNIKYRTLLRLINFREPIPELPKMCDVEPRCLDFRTTYKDMTKPGQYVDAVSRHAGVPSVRHDKDYPVTPEGLCSAYKVFLGDETDARCCISPSLMTQYSITHKDLYSKREPGQLRLIFEKAGRTFTDKDFNNIWEKAKQDHPDGLVCIETFNKASKNFLKHESQESNDLK